MYGYVYKTTILNSESELNGYYYIGQKVADHVIENYYGSGPTLRKYFRTVIKSRHARKVNKDAAVALGLHREILAWANTREELDELEVGYVNAELNNLHCLNRMTGGSGYAKCGKTYLDDETLQYREDEVFVDIEGTHYQISNYGRVKNKDTGHINSHFVKNRVGYVRAVLYDGNSNKTKYLIHRLVANAFIPNPDPENKIQVNHKDGDRTNNKATNLEWVSKSENMLHSYHITKRKTGFAHGFGGYKTVWNKGIPMSDKTKAKRLETMARNTPEVQQEIFTKYKAGKSPYELAKEYGFNKKLIKNTIKRIEKRMKNEQNRSSTKL